MLGRNRMATGREEAFKACAVSCGYHDRLYRAQHHSSLTMSKLDLCGQGAAGRLEPKH